MGDLVKFSVATKTGTYDLNIGVGCGTCLAVVMSFLTNHSIL